MSIHASPHRPAAERVSTAILNICIAYSSQDEITTAVNSAVRLSLDKEKSNPDKYVTFLALCVVYFDIYIGLASAAK
jgi:undecaprenyl pyrophosphate synthase